MNIVDPLSTILFTKNLIKILSKEMNIDPKLFKLFKSTDYGARLRLEIKTNNPNELKYNGFSLDIRHNRGTLHYTDRWQEIPLDDKE